LLGSAGCRERWGGGGGGRTLGAGARFSGFDPDSFVGAGGSFADGPPFLAFSGAAVSAGKSSAPEGAGGGAEREAGRGGLGLLLWRLGSSAMNIAPGKHNLSARSPA
jgi:hypothetical protein